MNKIKYPRTFHLPWSLGVTSDDKVIKNVDHFVGKEVVITEKMDGENTTLYKDYLHARSIDSKHHLSREWVKAFHSTISYMIPENIRICGENLYAKHSIEYDNLKSYFYGFSVWNENCCLSWEDSLYYMDELGITPVPVLYKGVFDIDIIKSLDISGKEGYVIRNTEQFMYHKFCDNVAKFVRANHVQTDKHWMHSEVIKNKLIGEKIME